MISEQRDSIVQSKTRSSTRQRRSEQRQTKSFNISKHEVVEAYRRVKANKGSAGVDEQSLADFDKDRRNNLYKIWNRLSSGSYFPPPVKCVLIPKIDGNLRPLGIPTVSDRIAQMVIKQRIEPRLEAIFHPNSYGYRPHKSAHQALGVARQRCWQRGWVLDMDIKGFFDHIDHELLMRAVNQQVEETWIRLYIERWLKADIKHPDGRLEKRNRGTPQGGVISPLLANLYLHYVFDVWVEKHWPGIQFERYADDIICHCASEKEALALKALLDKRFTECGLTLHPTKTQIAYCKSDKFPNDHAVVSFDFLGHTFKPRMMRSRDGVYRLGFTPSISGKAAKRIRQVIKGWKILKASQATLEGIARFSRATIMGWVNYYGKYGRKGILSTLHYFDSKLIRWVKRKYKRLSSIARATRWLIGVKHRESNLFVHWALAKC